MKFSEQVKIVRQKLNLTQMELAAALCVSFSSINRWERGHTEPPQVVKKVFYDYCEKNKINLINQPKEVL